MDQNFNNDQNNFNNQPINNQNFNQGMGVNPQPVNQMNNSFQQQNIEQPVQPQTIEQPITQESTPQPVNTVEGNNDNRDLNSKPPKKINLGLIIGIVVGIAIAVGLIIFFVNRKDGNGENGKELITNKTSMKKIEKMISDNEKYVLTNYVDSYNKMVIKYPIFYGQFHESDVAHYGTKYNSVMIETILGLFNMVIHFPSDDNGDIQYFTPAEKNYKDVDDFFNSYYLLNAKENPAIFLEFNGSEFLNFFYSYKDYKKIGDYSYNDINWSEYLFTLQNKNDNSKTKNVHVWIMVNNGVPYVIRFYDVSKDENLFNKYSIADYNLSDDSWKEIVDNAEAIREYIISNISFVDDYEKLLNTKEASVTQCDGAWDDSYISSDQSLLYVPNCVSGDTIYREAFYGKVYSNYNKINISSALSMLQEELKPLGTLKKQSDVYTLKNASLGEFQAQKVAYVDELNRQHLIYIICNDDIYGWIATDKSIEDSYLEDIGEHMVVNLLDFAVKNIRYSDDRWEGSNWVE